jgi:hypothetical protein
MADGGRFAGWSHVRNLDPSAESSGAGGCVINRPRSYVDMRQPFEQRSLHPADFPPLPLRMSCGAALSDDGNSHGTQGSCIIREHKIQSQPNILKRFHQEV